MSKIKIAILTLSLFFCISSANATIQTTVSPEFGSMGGTTEYDMDIEFNYIDTTGVIPTSVRWKLRSLLEFPLDVYFGGLSAHFNSIEDPNRWKFHLKYLTNLNNPDGSMVDSDWEEVSNQFPYTKFSETNSNSKIKLSYLEAEFQFSIVEKRNFVLSLFAGGSYQKLENDIIGLEGWQRQYDTVSNTYGDQFYFDVYQDSLVGTYEQTVKQIRIGLISDINLSQQLSSQIKFGFAPAFYKDIDDHVLRFKLSDSDGDGKGIYSGFSLQYNMSQSGFSFIRLNSTYTYFTAHGSQTQTWYADDPASPEDDTGESYSGLPHTVRTKQYTIGLEAGYTF